MSGKKSIKLYAKNVQFVKRLNLTTYSTITEKFAKNNRINCFHVE